MPSPRAVSVRTPAAILLVVLALVATPAGAQEEDPGRTVPLSEADYARLVAATLDGHVLPTVRHFRDTADRLAAALPPACTAPSEATVTSARAAFAETADAFATLDPIRLGPLVEANRLERLNFWPDPRGLGLKQVQALLAKEDPSALDPAGLAGKSVAVQGLGALEFVLYGSGSETLATAAAGDYRCRYGAAVAAGIARTAADLVAGWETGSGRLYREPGPDNPLFLSHAEAAGDLVAGMATALEILADQKLKTPLDAAPERARPRLAPFWRSGRTFTGMAATLAAIDRELAAGGYAGVLEPAAGWLTTAVPFELRTARKTLESIAVSPEAAYADPVARGRLAYVRSAAASLKFIIGSRYAGALGLEQGFNSLDGD